MVISWGRRRGYQEFGGERSTVLPGLLASLNKDLSAIDTSPHGVDEFLHGGLWVPQQGFPRHFSQRFTEVRMVFGGGGNNQTFSGSMPASKLVAAKVTARAQHNEGGVSG